MKALLVILGYSALLSLSDKHRNVKRQSDENNLVISADSIHFAIQVMPLLQRKCSPCHFEGGKMYDKMPFDKASTIVHHEAGILKRFSDEEKSIIVRFIKAVKERNNHR